MNTVSTIKIDSKDTLKIETNRKTIEEVYKLEVLDNVSVKINPNLIRTDQVNRANKIDTVLAVPNTGVQERTNQIQNTFHIYRVCSILLVSYEDTIKID